MKLFERLFKRKKTKDDSKEKEALQPSIAKLEGSSVAPSNTQLPDWVDSNMTEEERNLVSAIAAAGLANSLPQKKYQVKQIYKVDEDWLIAGLAAISGVSQGKENERYRIKSIRRVK